MIKGEKDRESPREEGAVERGISVKYMVRANVWMCAGL